MRLIRALLGAAVAVPIACSGHPLAPPITSVVLSANSSWSAGQDWWHVTFRGDLTCEWIGNLETARRGEYDGVLDPEQWQRVVSSVESLGIERMRDQYDNPMANDARHLVVVVHRGEQSKSVDDYASAGPPELRQLEVLLLGLADEVAWQQRTK